MSYTGFGVYQQPPPPPPPKPNRRPLWIALAAVAVLAVAGTVTGVVIANRSSDEPAAPTSSVETSARPEWQVVEDTAAEIRFEVPPSWENSGGGVAGRVRLTKTMVSRPFECQGRSMVQALVGSGGVVGDSMVDVAMGVATTVARSSYTVDEVEPVIAEPVTTGSDGDERLVLSVAVTPSGVSACYAPKATVTVVALRKEHKVCVVVLNVAEGGPHVAEGPSEADAKRILESVRLP